jgi:hypothetical protein
MNCRKGAFNNILIQGHHPSPHEVPTQRGWSAREAPRDQPSVAPARSSTGYKSDSDFRAVTPSPTARTEVQPHSWESSQEHTRTSQRAEPRRRTRFDSGPARPTPAMDESAPRTNPNQISMETLRERFSMAAAEHHSAGAPPSLEIRLSERFEERVVESIRRSPPPPSSSTQVNNQDFNTLRRSRSDSRVVHPNDDPHRVWEYNERTSNQVQQHQVRSPVRMHPDRVRILGKSPSYGADYHDARSLPSSHDRRAEHVPEPPARDNPPPSRFDGATASSHYRPERNSEYMDMSSRAEYDHETRPPRRLLDRLSFGTELDNVAPSPSLRDRVQVPLKRDRDDVVGELNEYGAEFDVDDGVGMDPNRRTKKRGNGRVRRGRRNGIP